MKKLFISILTGLFLVGCATSTSSAGYKIIEPVTKEDPALFDEKGVEKVTSFYEGSVDLQNFAIVGSKIPDMELTRYNGDTVNLSSLEGKTVVEYVAEWCGYCKQQEQEHLDELVSVFKDYGINFVQVFVVGDKEKIDAFMEEAEKDPSRNNPVIESEELLTYAQEVAVPAFPALVFYDESKQARWVNVGVVDEEGIKKLIDTAYDDDPLYNHFPEKQPVRTVDDLKADLGEEFVNKVTELSSSAAMEFNAYMNMGVPMELTGKMNTLEVGKTLDFDNLKDTTLFTFVLACSEDEELATSNDYFIQTLNLWAEKHPEVDIVYLMIEYDTSPAVYYKNLEVKPVGYAINANDESVPSQLYGIHLYDAPSIVYYSKKDSVLTGGYIGTVSEEKFEEAYNLFKDGYKIPENSEK